MAVDRGGLQYEIQVINEFSGPLRQFRTEVVQARKSFRSFKKSLSGLRTGTKAASKALRDHIRVIRNGVAATNKSSVANRKNITSVRDNTAAQRAANTAQKAANRARSSSVAAIRKENTALTSQAVALRKTATARNSISRSGATALNAQATAVRKTATAQKKLASTSKSAARGIDRTATAARRGQSSFGGMALTVKRLATTLVFFAGARLVLDGFRSLIAGTIEYSASLEEAELGIATLITATDTLVDSDGKRLEGLEALEGAQRIAKDQLQKLRIESLRTAGTFEDLALAFQTAFAVGREGGLNIDEIRKFAVSISQAASSLKVEQRQLSEEIRSILSGTIKPQNTRIGVALKIKNEDIRKARELGQLPELLEKKFAAFGVASGAILNTFTARITNAKGALFELTRVGGLEFFQALKDLLLEITETSIDFENFEPDPDLVNKIRVLFQPLTGGVKQARNFFKEFQGIGRSMGNIAAAVSAVLSASVQILAPVFAGVVRGAEDILRVFNVLRVLIGKISGNTKGILPEETLERAGRFLGTFVRIFVAVRGTAIAMALMTSSLGAAVILAGSLALLFGQLDKNGQKLLDVFTGIENSTLDGVFAVAAARTKAFAKNFLLRVAGAIKTLGKTLNAVFEESVVSLRDGLASALDQFLGSKIGKGILATLKIDTDSRALKALKEAANQASIRLSLEERIKRTIADQNKETIEASAIDARRAELRAAQDLGAFLRRKKLFDREKVESDRRFKEALDTSIANAERALAEARARTKSRLSAEGVSQVQGGFEFVGEKDLSGIRSSLKLEESIASRLAEQKRLRLELADIRAKRDSEAVSTEKRLRAAAKETAAITERTVAKTIEGQIAANLAEVDAVIAQQSKLENSITKGAIPTGPIEQAKLTVISSLDEMIAKAKDLGFELGDGMKLAIEKLEDAANDMPRSLDVPFDATKAKVDDLFASFRDSAQRLFIDTVASAIVDIFDPESTKTAKERFIDLLKSLAKEAISILLQIALVRIFALGGSGSVPGAADGGAAGSVGGGQVGHSNARGFAAGGSSLLGMSVPNLPVPLRSRPAGLDPRDTVPIWVQPREWIIRKDSSLLYGNRVMSAINRGLIDPMALKALAGQRPSVTRRVSRGAGFQTGGRVSSSAGRATGGGQEKVVGAVMVADEQAMERLVAGGRNALLEFIAEESSAIKGLLS